MCPEMIFLHNVIEWYKIYFIGIIGILIIYELYDVKTFGTLYGLTGHYVSNFMHIGGIHR